MRPQLPFAQASGLRGWMVGCTGGLVGWLMGLMASVLGRSSVGGAGWVAGWLAGGELVALDWFKGVRNLLRSALDVTFFA